jgi:hypothetical protein
MRLQIIVILLVIVGVATGLAQLGEEQITITVTSDGKAKISQTLFPKTFVSTIDVQIISEKISNLLAIDEKNILLGTTQNQDLLKIATLGASAVDLKYNAGILTYESGVFKLKYNSDLESRVNLPTLSKLVSLNTIPVAIADKQYVLPPGDISLSYSIRPVTSKEFFIPVGNSEQKVETITATKIEEFSANADEISFIIKDKAIVLTIIPKLVMTNPNDALLNGEEVDFSQFHQNATHSWIRIDPHEKGLVRILNEPNEGGGCLIATATYGSEMAPQVQLLREIRDNQLMNTDSGVSFMIGFNQLYYSFSPYIADMERENPIFKELVKIAITPMLLSLSIMTVAESENEVLGVGVGVILMNVGMYFVLPFVICYHVKKIIRTKGVQQSNLRVIFNCNVLSVVKTGLFGLMALLVLTVSVSSAFETVYADEDDPIRVILDITHQNIIDSIEIATENGDLTTDEAAKLIDSVEMEYMAAVDLTNGEDVVAAKESVIQAMASFEVIAGGIESLENQASTQLPPGFGAGFDSASDTGITQGQGLGVGGVPPGILKQITAANIFEIQEGITGIDEEVNELRGLIESNNLDVNLEEFDKSINLAKEVLASGEIPNAQAKLALANEIKNDLYDQIDAAVEESQDERIEQFVENSIKDIESVLEKGENLGLTKQVIDELQDTLDVLKSGDIDDIIEKTSEDSEFAKEIEGNDEISKEFEDDGPGNSENASGQNKEDEKELREENKEAEKELREENKEDEKDLREENKEDEKDLREENKEDEKELRETDPDAAKELKEENKESEKLLKEENKESEKLLKEENKEAEKLLKEENKEAEKLLKEENKEDEKLLKEENKDKDEKELPPGFDSASDTGKENGNGKGLGLENIPPGQLKKLDIGYFGEYSADDTFEFSAEGLIEDSWEDNYDKMFKGSKEKQTKDKKVKQNEERLLKEKGNTGGGNPNCFNEGITDGDSTNLTGEVGVDYTVLGFEAVGSNCKDATDQIRIVVDGPSGQFEPNADQPYTFQPDEAGTWIIQASAVGQFGFRQVEVTGGLDADAGPDQIVTDCSDITLDGSLISPTFTPVDVSSETTYTFTLTVRDDEDNENEDSVDITVTDGGVCGGGNVAPTIDSISAESPVPDDGINDNSLSATVTDPDSTPMYLWTYSAQGNITVNIDNASSLSTTFGVPDFNGPATRTVTFTLTVDDGVNDPVQSQVQVTVNNT